MAIKFLNTVAVDTDVLYVDAANNRVGIGTTSPDYLFEVEKTTSGSATLASFKNTENTSIRISRTGTSPGTSILNVVNNGALYTSSDSHIAFQPGNSTSVFLQNTGNVGIGTTSPNYKLQVAGKSYLSGGIQLNSGDEIDFGNSQQYITGVNDTSLTLATGGSATLTALDNGNVGIGTTSPSAPLHVDGNIRQEGSTYSVSILGGTTVTGDNHLDIAANASYLNLRSPNNSIFYRAGSDHAFKDSGGSNEYLRIKTSGTTAGNVGIGTTSPQSALEVVDSANYKGIHVRGNAAPNITFGQNLDATAEWKIGISGFNGDSFSIGTGTGANDKVHITSAGNVGIGTTSPSAKLQVGGTTDSNGSSGSFNVAGSYGIESWARSYSVSNTNVLSILQANNTALQNGGAYRVTGHIDGTGTDNASRAVFWNQDGTWYCNVTSASGTSSNNILFLIDATTGLPSIKTYHANDYTVRVWHERINLNEVSGTDNTRHYFGADAYMTQIGNDISMFTSYSGNNTVGNLGIGTASPSQKLQVAGNIKLDNGAIILSGSPAGQGAQTRYISGAATTNDLWFNVPTNGRYRFAVADSQLVEINSSGNVGIGTTSPSQKLHVAGNMRLTGAFRDGVNSQGSANYVLTSTGSNSTRWVDASTVIGGPYLPLAGGTMTGDTKRGDNIYSYWGNSDDLAIYHLNGASSIYDRGAGNLNIFTNGGSIGLRKDSGENMLIANIDGSVDLYYDNSKKLATTSAGVTSYGAITITDTTGTRGINRNNTGYNLDLMGGTDNTDGAYISLSGETRGGAANPYNGRMEFYSGGSGLATRADALGDIIFGTKWSGGFAQFLVLDSSSGDATFSNNVGIGTTSPSQKLHVVGTSNFQGAIQVSGGTFVDSTRRNIYLNSFSGGDGNGIFFRDGFTYNASITVEDHNGSSADGICISGYDGVSFSTGANSKNERMRIATNGNVGIGTTAPSYKLEVQGPTDSQGFVNDEGGNKNRLLFPKGGSLNSGPTTGAITVKLPVLWTNTMLRITLRVFDYSQNESFDVTVAGYNYVGSGSGGSWVNTSAWISSQSDIDRNFSVRFGNDGTNSLFYIGELDSSWSYLKVNIVDVELNHAATVTDWSTTAWSISMETTAFANVSQIRTNCQVNNWKRNGQDVYYGSGTGNVGIGTTSPQSKLHIADSTLSLLKVQETSGNTGASAGALFKTSPNTGNSYFKGGILYEDTGNANVIGKLHLVNRVSADTTNAGVGDAKLTIDTVGNVGIGTTGPGAKLDVVGSYAAVPLKVLRHGDYGNVINIGRNGVSETANIGYPADSTINLSTAGSERVRINATGNVGIGTTSPGAKLDVRVNGIGNSAGDESDSILFQGDRHDWIFKQIRTAAATDWNSTTLRLQTRVDSSNMSSIDFVTDASYNRHIDINTASNSFSTRFAHNGNVGIGTTSPSNRLQVSGGSIGIDSEYMIRDNRNNTILLQSASTAASNRSLTIGNATYSNVIIPNGNVGIGTTSPGYTLDVNGSIHSTNITIADAIYHEGDTNNYIQFHTADQWRVVTGGVERLEVQNTQVTVANNFQVAGSIYAAQYIYHSGDTNTYMRFPSNDTISWNTAGSERMRINSSGNIGIGTTAPTNKLHVTGTIYGNGGIIGSSDLWLRDQSSAYSTELKMQNNTHTIGIDYQNNETLRFITRSGTTTVPITFAMRTGNITCVSLTQTSDERKKTKIKDLSGDNIDVRWRSFEMKANEGEYRTGVIAQELEQNHPEFVNTDDEGLKSVKYIDLLIAKIAELETRIKQLENN